MTIEDAKDQALESLGEDEQELLSAILFPREQKDWVELYGKTRSVHPLPVRMSRELHAYLKPIQERIISSQEDTDNSDIDLDLVDALLEITKMLAKFYEWDDVLKALETEDIPLGQMQDLCKTQADAQGKNDFLSAGLHSLVNLMSLAEIQLVGFQKALIGSQLQSISRSLTTS